MKEKSNIITIEQLKKIETLINYWINRKVVVRLNVMNSLHTYLSAIAIEQECDDGNDHLQNQIYDLLIDVDLRLKQFGMSIDEYTDDVELKERKAHKVKRTIDYTKLDALLAEIKEADENGEDEVDSEILFLGREDSTS